MISVRTRWSSICNKHRRPLALSGDRPQIAGMNRGPGKGEKRGRDTDLTATPLKIDTETTNNPQ